MTKTDSSPPIVVIGFGGHGRVVAAACLAAGRRIVAATDLAPSVSAGQGWGFDVLPDEVAIERFTPDQVELVLGVGSVTPSDEASPRRSIVRSLKDRGYTFASVRHPAAWIASDVIVGEGVQVHAGAVVQPGVTLSPFAILNTHCSVDHDCRIGEFCHIGPGATLSADIDVGQGSHLGTGCNLIQGIAIGDACFVAAGATVARDVEARQYVRGTPARVYQPRSR